MEDERLIGGDGNAGDGLKRQRRARNTPAADEERLLSGRAWTDFCEALEAAGDHVLNHAPASSPRERAEGFRYLAGLASAALRQQLLFADPDRPRFLRNPDSASKWGAENADNLYLWTRIRSDRCYRVRGRRNNVFEFLLEVKEGYMQLGDDRNFATLSAAQLEVEADGSFEIALGGARREGNWIPLDPDARYMAIRQYFYDWEKERPAEFEIFELGHGGESPLPLEPAYIAHMLDDTGEWVETSIRFWNQWVDRLKSDFARAGDRNRMAPARRYVGGADDIYYGNGWYELGEDEALVIESDLPRARYWSFQLCDLWFASMDYTHRQSSLNGHQARIDADGRFRCVVAHRDPGVPNWLDTAGRREGIIQYRWIWTEDNPQPTARVISFDELHNALPEDTPVVSSDARRDAIRIRQEHMARREPAG